MGSPTNVYMSLFELGGDWGFWLFSIALGTDADIPTLPKTGHYWFLITRIVHIEYLPLNADTNWAIEVILNIKIL